ncbi:hypothetical protein EWM64_g9009 [Hericium alpestre]|uniref:Uncharacterized protein n=1 Tax=Hericium alpestre TaxID=135208 RepID=A0A4Y9ZKN2_9AGAM|nr:hypothetical protein EWM64_g9009 [Hericium alpestre]
MEFNITWFSPIEPGDWVWQSMPLSYLYIEAASLDGNSHSVQIYSDVDGEWLSGSIVRRSKPEDAMEDRFQLGQHVSSSESDQRNNPGVTYKIDLVDPDFRPISNPYTVFAIAADLGTISSTQRPVVWAIGLTRDPALSYVDLGGIQQNRSLYYQQNYTDDTSLVYGMTELTVSKNPDGSSNTSDVMMFMKNIGGAAEKRVNAVEVLYQSFPLFMYMDAKLGAPLLEPLLRFQDSANYTNTYAATDLVLPAVRDHDANLVRGDVEELRREIQLMRQGLEPPPYFEGTMPGGQ